SMLELVDRPAAYEDVGNLCRWGMVIHELKSYEAEMALLRTTRQTWEPQSIDEYVVERRKAREVFTHELERVSAPKDAKSVPLIPESRPRRRIRRLLSRRRGDPPGKLVPPRPTPYLDRRGTSLLPANNERDRRRLLDRRRKQYAIPFPDRRLTRSAYEQVFLKLVSGGKLRVGNDIYRPVGMKGWYHAIFRRDSDGAERLLSIDQLLQRMNDWI